jgi:hypothetical protein
MAQDIFTGQPLTGESLKDWEDLKLKQKMTKDTVTYKKPKRVI